MDGTVLGSPLTVGRDAYSRNSDKMKKSLNYKRQKGGRWAPQRGGLGGIGVL
jgi:hypothetical protein